jgi:hypothetical protein
MRSYAQRKHVFSLNFVFDTSHRKSFRILNTEAICCNHEDYM